MRPTFNRILTLATATRMGFARTKKVFLRQPQSEWKRQ